MTTEIPVRHLRMPPMIPLAERPAALQAVRRQKVSMMQAMECLGVELRKLVPELDCPVYCATELKFAEVRPNVMAFTHPHLSHTLRPFLPVWAGPGIAMAFNAVEMNEYTKRTPFGWAEMYFCTGIHELSHALSHAPPYFSETPPCDALRELRPDIVPVLRETVRAEVGPPWFLHEADTWLRLLLHLCHRASSSRWCPASAAVDAELYGLSRVGEYAKAIGDEPQRMAGATIEKIKVEPLPAAYLELWQFDKGRWK